MARPVSINVADIANRANVSTASVSRVINNQSGVSEKLRSKIRKILEEDDRYSAHISGRGVRIAVVMEMDKPHINTFTSAMLAGAANYSLQRNVDISTVFVQSAEKKNLDFLRLLRDRRCDGVILLLSSILSQAELTKLAKARMAVMVLNGRCDYNEAGYLYTDPNEGMTLLLNHLSQLGHQNIAYLAGPQVSDFDNSRRAEVFLNHLHHAGNPLVEKLLIKHIPTKMAQEAGYLQAEKVLRNCPETTALIANNDEMAYGALLACHEAGKRVPDDISIAGFDDYANSQFTVPPLTTVRQHLNEVGYEAVQAIDEFVCGSLDTLPRRVFKPELVVRGSTVAVPAATRSL
ncbi:LacI family DNA-binding transcriptional regulator [Kiritimatiellaeota bacterium B1221]|nr:LacI family DNA-binding transcriptional regulator [Kiritimatiellaeota bacterium B1221]